jgi:hypothetical protein
MLLLQVNTSLFPVFLVFRTFFLKVESKLKINKSKYKHLHETHTTNI